ncbi:DEAD/DEAH box helicase [Desulfurococcaceae archaeon MEX13E-LK6-19]|nr:DEAD/DEAH box helicase [Desulfurococcaceae archaeon MEX13E-LK6-19]
MRITDSIKYLESRGYSIVYEVEPFIEPERVDKRFTDIVEELGNLQELKEFASNRLYLHQFEAYNALLKGSNVILRSGTGSGKTEAWVMYFLNKVKQDKSFKAIAVYPTLALANDQIRRITLYSRAIGANVVQLDAPHRDMYMRELGRTKLRQMISSANIVVTNPAFLLHELKKYFIKQSSSLLESFFRKIDLIIIDELDFYGPRSLALLMAMIELLSIVSNVKPQVVLLTATLANPDELGSYLKDITGRDYVVIDGKPFHVENRLIVVLGKDLENVWKKIRGYLGSLSRRSDVDEDIIKALRDYKEFVKNPYRVLSYLEALGYDVPSIGIDYSEILGAYLEDDGVTLVFTKSIAKAEEVAKRLKTVYQEHSNRIASHHHLVSKEQRRQIEEAARRGEMKIIVSPRTLSQGIDIGTIVRIVHLGLPEDVREFIQREGRKGRRLEIPFTESIVIPSSRWDWDLLTKGLDALKKWLSLPLEKTIIIPRNLYIKLFTGIVKLLSPWLGLELSDHEKEALEKAGVLKKTGVDKKKLKWIWDRMGFYEFAPPYGIKRYLETKDGVRSLEPIGHCDLVERFQIGCIDYSSDAMVVRHSISARGRTVTAVYEKPLWEIRFWEDEALAEAYEEYLDIKTRWGEEPSLVKDLMRGKINTHVHCVVYPPRHGFGLLIKVPNRVVWIVSSEKPRVIKIKGRHVVTRDKKTIYVPTPVHGEYRDYTYGYIYEVDERLDTALLRLGLAYIMIVLRRVYGIAFETIMYGVEKIGDKKFFELHEPEATALIDELDWLDVRKSVMEYKPDELDLILLNQIDELAYADMLTLGVDWEPVREYALKILDYILSKEKIVVEISGLIEAIPKPSKAQKIVALDAIVEEIGGEDVFSPPLLLIAVAVFDGEETRTYIDLVLNIPGLKPKQELREIENLVEDLVYYNNFKIVVPARNIADSLEKTGLKKLPVLIRNTGIEAYSLTREELKNITIEDLFEVLPRIYGDMKIPRLPRIHRIVEKIRENKYTKLLDSEKDEITKHMEARVKALYLLYMLASSKSSDKK